MSNPRTSPYEQACEEYRRLIGEYGDALTAKSPSAGVLLEEARVAWERICAIAPTSPEAQAGSSMHLTLAFSFASGANDAVEAERLYQQMSDDDRRKIDESDARVPGTMKIWAKK